MVPSSECFWMGHSGSLARRVSLQVRACRAAKDGLATKLTPIGFTSSVLAELSRKS